MATVVVMWEMPTFECGDLFAALDARRDEDGLGWYEIADELFMLRWLDRARPGGLPDRCGGRRG